MENTIAQPFVILAEHAPSAALKTPWLHTVRDFVTLRASTSLIRSKESLLGAYQNLGVISALMMTLVAVQRPDVGSEFVSEEFSAQLYVVLAMLNTIFFFASTLLSTFVCLLASGCESDAEILTWSTACPTIFKMALFFFNTGLILYMTHVVLQFFSLCGVNALTGSIIVFGWLTFFAIVYALLDSYRTVHGFSRKAAED
jgi:hypothetical protein